MKSYDYNACTYDGDIYCMECLPALCDKDEVMPIFADNEWDCIPICCECGMEHDYISLLQ